MESSKVFIHQGKEENSCYTFPSLKNKTEPRAIFPLCRFFVHCKFSILLAIQMYADTVEIAKGNRQTVKFRRQQRLLIVKQKSHPGCRAHANCSQLGFSSLYISNGNCIARALRFLSLHSSPPFRMCTYLVICAGVCVCGKWLYGVLETYQDHWYLNSWHVSIPAHIHRAHRASESI